MIRAAISYQASYFADLDSLAPNADVIPPLLEAFRDEGFLPTTFRQFDAQGVHTRLRLASQDNEWLVDLERHRINVTKQPTAAWGENLGSIDQFVLDVTDYMQRVLTQFPTPGTRFACVSKNLLEISEEDAIQEVYKRLVSPIPFYEGNRPVEWNSRAVSHIPVQIAQRDETMNVIMNVLTTKGRFATGDGPVPFEGLSLELDINTYQGDKDARFSGSNLSEFFDLALAQRQLLIGQLQERLHD